MTDIDESDERDVKRFGRLVRARRQARGWKLDVLAQEAFSNGDRKGYVSAIELGKIPNITRNTVRNIARALEIDLEEIPESLRWPEANQTVRDTNRIVRETQDTLTRFLSENEGRIRSHQINEGMLLSLARRFSQKTPFKSGSIGTFEEALEQIEQQLEISFSTADLLRRLSSDRLRSILEGAIVQRDLETLEALLSIGVDIEDDEIAYGSALELLLEEREHGETQTILKILELFFSYGANPDQKCTHGASLLSCITYLDEVEISRYLINKGVDINRRGWGGETVLQSAAGFGAENGVALLLEHGADPNIAADDGWTPLIEASSLRASGAVDDYEGEEQRRIRVCRALLDHGADLSATTNRGETAMSEAKDSEFFALHEFLVSVRS